MLLKLIALEFNVSFWWLKDGKDEQEVQEKGLDYFERNNLDSFHSSNIESLLKVIQNLESSAPTEMDVNINTLTTHFQILLDELKENDKFKTIIFDNLSNIIVSYTELISKLQNLRIDDKTYINKIFSSIRMTTVDIEDNLIDLGNLYSEKLKQI